MIGILVSLRNLVKRRKFKIDFCCVIAKFSIQKISLLSSFSFLISHFTFPFSALIIESSFAKDRIAEIKGYIAIIP